MHIDGYIPVYLNGKTVIIPCWKHCRRCVLMSPCMYFNFLGSMPLTTAVALAIENSPQSFEPSCFWHSTILILSQQNNYSNCVIVQGIEHRIIYQDLIISAHHSSSYNPVAIMTINNLNVVFHKFTVVFLPLVQC